MQFDSDGTVATLNFDDGKVNAIGHGIIDDIVAGLSWAQTEASAVLTVGRDGLLSGGFDLKVIREGGDAVRVMMKKVADLFYRLLTHPQPLVIACTGHAVAAGAFLLSSGHGSAHKSWPNCRKKPMPRTNGTVVAGLSQP